MFCGRLLRVLLQSDDEDSENEKSILQLVLSYHTVGTRPSRASVVLVSLRVSNTSGRLEKSASRSSGQQAM